MKLEKCMKSNLKIDLIVYEIKLNNLFNIV